MKEELACLIHDIWGEWMDWMVFVSNQNNDGSITIPKEKVERWTRQRNTNYFDLPENEKQSDRELVKRILEKLDDC